MESCASGYGPMAGSYKHGNEATGFINGGEIYWQVEWLPASQEGLYSMISKSDKASRSLKKGKW
jgi:hypothetical protein